jgi:HK97 family phage major capsid protein
MSWTEIKDNVEKINGHFEQYKKDNDKRLEELAKGNTARAGELDERLGKLDNAIALFQKMKTDLTVEMEAHQQRIEELEARKGGPGKGNGAREKRLDEYKDVFCNWIRNRGQSPADEQKLQQLTKSMIEHKDVTVGSGAGGGFGVPEEMARTIEKLEMKFSPVRRMVKVVQTGSSDYKELVNIRGANAGWVGEAGPRTGTDTSQLREVAPTMGELYAYPQASEWSLDDIFFNVEEWLSTEVADAFSIREGDAIIRGNGSSKPTGMLNSAPTTSDDSSFGEPPVRAAAVYQYVTGSGSPNELDGDLLLSLIYKLNAVYRTNATFVMNSVTTGHIRKLKDANGVYLWAPGLQAGQPDRLLGFGVETWEQMDDVGAGAGNFPVAFGDFRRGYVLTDRVGMRITRDNVTNVGFVRFYVRRREGGIVLNNDAIKWIRT